MASGTEEIPQPDRLCKRVVNVSSVAPRLGCYSSQVPLGTLLIEVNNHTLTIAQTDAL